MDAYDTLTQYTSAQRTFTVNGIPTPNSVDISSAYWMLKNYLTDADNLALVSLNVTSSPTSAGVVTNDGLNTGSGQLDFVIGNDALAAITDFDSTYYATVKVVLSNGMVAVVTEYPVKVLKAGICATS